MTILEVINKTTPYFEKHGVDSPRLTIELLLAHVLQKKRMQLYLEFEQGLDEPTLEKLRPLVKRRVDGEPLQYITGATEFFGLKFAVDRRVLIPRPETELLVETVIARAPATVVEVGVGSGCIAVTLAKKLPATELWAVDVSADALAVAQANAARHEVEKRIRFLESDLLSNLPVSLQVEAIVSNPPYIASGDWAKLPKEVRDFEPALALTAGEDGLEIIRRLVTTARRILSPTGFVALEIGAGQRGAVETIFGSAQFVVRDVVKDLQGHERVMVAQPAKPVE